MLKITPHALRLTLYAYESESNVKCGDLTPDFEILVRFSFPLTKLESQTGIKISYFDLLQDK